MLLSDKVCPDLTNQIFCRNASGCLQNLCHKNKKLFIIISFLQKSTRWGENVAVISHGSVSYRKLKFNIFTKFTSKGFNVWKNTTSANYPGVQIKPSAKNTKLYSYLNRQSCFPEPKEAVNVAGRCCWWNTLTEGEDVAACKEDGSEGTHGTLLLQRLLTTRVWSNNDKSTVEKQ